LENREERQNATKGQAPTFYLSVERRFVRMVAIGRGIRTLNVGSLALNEGFERLEFESWYRIGAQSKAFFAESDI
jgi:hypothetical protein